MTVAVLVPWRPDHAERSRNWAWLKRQWENAYGWEIIEGHCPAGPWNKALAVADALSKTTADTVVIADADIWCPDTHLAVKAIHSGATWAIPHRKVYRLAPDPTDKLIDGRLNWSTIGYPKLDQTPYVGIAGGGIIAIRRDLYEKAPFDPRFNGWGGEDSAAGITWTALAGPPRRGTAPLWHLWHPPQPRLTRVKGSLESDALLTRYKQARHHTPTLESLIDEAREAPCPVPCTPAPPPDAPSQYQPAEADAPSINSTPTAGEAQHGNAATTPPTSGASAGAYYANTHSAPAHQTTHPTRATPAPNHRLSPTTGRKTAGNW